MAISVRSASQNIAGGAATSYTVPAPAGVSAGDLLVAFTISSGTVFTDLTSNEFTQTGANSSTTSSAPAGRVWLRTAGASEPSNYTFGKTANLIGAGQIVALIGADTANPVDAAVSWGNGAASTSHVAPTVSPAGVGSYLVCGWTGKQNTGATYTVPGSMTEQGDQSSGALLQGLATELLAASGATGTRTGTASTTGLFGWNAFSVAIMAAAAVSGRPVIEVVTPQRPRPRPVAATVTRTPTGASPRTRSGFLPFFT